LGSISDMVPQFAGGYHPILAELSPSRGCCSRVRSDLGACFIFWGASILRCGSVRHL